MHPAAGRFRPVDPDERGFLLLPRHAFVALLLFCAGCSAPSPPPPRLLFAGLPVSGDRGLADAKGFRECLNMNAVRLRCQRSGVFLWGQGPYRAAVDMGGADGESGFDQLTLWHDDDQDAVYRLIGTLKRTGWRYCYTGPEDAGDQAIFTRRGAPVRLSIDISYYGKRRVRILPASNRQGLGERCTPDDSVLRFGADVARDAAR